MDKVKDTFPQQRPQRRKLFRNIWLFTILLPVILFILLVALSMNNYNEDIANILMVSTAITIPIGIISFLIWIFFPNIKNVPKLSRILDIFLGIIIASCIALTVYCVTYIYSYENNLGTVFYDLIALVALFFTLFVWIKIQSKKILFKSIIVFLLIVMYFFGQIYAIRTYQTYIDAQNLFSDINSSESLEWLNETDTNKYLEGQRRYTDSLKTVSETPSEALRWGRKYYEDLYILQKEALDINEKLAAGGIVYTTEERDKLLKEYDERVYNAVNLQFPLPFWTSFFMVIR